MARTTSTNYSTPSFPKASADADAFDATDVQQLAVAVDGHVHGTGTGLPVNGVATGTITSGMIADGTIATADLANSSVTNAKLAADTARANLLTNGGFEIWQRGNGPFTASNAYTADRWVIGLAGTDTLSVSNDGSNVDAIYGGKQDALCTFTLGSGAGSSNLTQFLKWTDLAVSRVVTVSVRVRTATANAVRIGLHNGSAFTYSTFHSGGGTYETLSASVALAFGANAQLSIFFAASCSANIDNAMLVVGSVAADYAPLHPADDLARCLRYYEVLGTALGTPIGSGQAFSATQASIPFNYRVPKAVAPTITMSLTTDFQLETAAFGAAVLNGFSSVNVSANAADLRPTVASGLVAGNATGLYCATSTGRLVLESNP